MNILDGELAKGVGNYITRFALAYVIVNFPAVKYRMVG